MDGSQMPLSIGTLVYRICILVKPGIPKTYGVCMSFHTCVSPGRVIVDSRVLGSDTNKDLFQPQ